MRDARALALAIDQGCDADFAATLIEADRRAAKLEVLRELRASRELLLPSVLDKMIASLETEGPDGKA